ncbi:MAG: DUF4286 family protein [Ignavibacteriaceae bacterium]|nr:DUF4286 family protein [Ignavibacteriaceae bacterium]
MIIYNVEISIIKEHQTDFLMWMVEEHIPEVLASGYFSDAKFLQVLDPEDENNIHFEVQYDCDSLEKLREYRQVAAPGLIKKTEAKFGGKFTAKRTIMAYLNLKSDRVKTVISH